MESVNQILNKVQEAEVKVKTLKEDADKKVKELEIQTEEECLKIMEQARKDAKSKIAKVYKDNSLKLEKVQMEVDDNILNQTKNFGDKYNEKIQSLADKIFKEIIG